MVDEQSHELLGLRDGDGVFESVALEVDERETAQFYRIVRRLPLARGDGPALDDVPVVARGLDRRAAARLARKLEGEPDLLEEPQLEAPQHRLSHQADAPMLLRPRLQYQAGLAVWIAMEYVSPVHHLYPSCCSAISLSAQPLFTLTCISRKTLEPKRASMAWRASVPMRL